jgi:hypothetical protein
MSIVTMKKKTNAIKRSHGVEKEGFSVNGKIRSLGPNVVKRQGVRTIFKGTVAVGNGGGGRCRINDRRLRCGRNEYPVVIQRSCGCSSDGNGKGVQTTLMYLKSKLMCCKETVKEFEVITAPYVCEIKKEEKKCPPYVKLNNDQSYAKYQRGLVCVNRGKMYFS